MESEVEKILGITNEKPKNSKVAKKTVESNKKVAEKLIEKNTVTKAEITDDKGKTKQMVIMPDVVIDEDIEGEKSESDSFTKPEPRLQVVNSDIHINSTTQNQPYQPPVHHPMTPPHPQIPSFPGIPNELLQDPRLIHLYHQLLQSQQVMQNQPQSQPQPQNPQPQPQPAQIINIPKSPTAELKMFKEPQQVRPRVGSFA